MSAASDRRNAKARAAGFTSYGQQYRATKAGFASAGQYQATIRAKKQGGIVRQVAAGKLLGGAYTPDGLTIAASWRAPGAMAEQWQRVRRQSQGKIERHWSPDLGRVVEQRVGGKHVGIIVETVGGRILRLGEERGGYSIAYLRGLVREQKTWRGAVLELASYAYDYDASDDPPAVVTVTIR